MDHLFFKIQKFPKKRAKALFIIYYLLNISLPTFIYESKNITAKHPINATVIFNHNT